MNVEKCQQLESWWKPQRVEMRECFHWPVLRAPLDPMALTVVLCAYFGLQCIILQLLILYRVGMYCDVLRV